MAGVIELIGASGIGKTALYKRMSSGRMELSGVCTYQDVEKDVWRTMKGRGRLFRTVAAIAHVSLPSSTLRAASSRFNERFPELAEKAWEIISFRVRTGSISLDQAYHSAYLFNKNFAQNQIIREYNKKQYAIMSEGLCQRIMLHRGLTEDRVEAAFIHELGHVVSGVVLLDASDEIVFERQARRVREFSGQDDNQRSAPPLLEKISRNLERYRKFAAELKRSGIRCWVIDATGTVSETKSQIFDILYTAKKSDGLARRMA
ncbi:MAG: hypothetical protein JJU08_05895 [Rhodobacteraceae bacterium]|nr:hypothetical protein [Paracoccaceae bacterium]